MEIDVITIIVWFIIITLTITTLVEIDAKINRVRRELERHINRTQREAERENEPDST
jgi:large-conductance mechanosensitive channel